MKSSALRSAAKAANQDICDLIEEINTDFGPNSAYTADSPMLSDIRGWLSTGSTHLDTILGGGIPLGRVIEVFGMESSGKSTLLTHLFVNCQKIGVEMCGQPGLCVLVDYETTFSKQRAQRMGLDLKYLIELPVDTLDDGFDRVLGVVKRAKSKPEWQNRPIIVAFDTLAAAPTEIEKAGEKKEAMAAKAKIVQAGFRKVGRDFGRHAITFIVVNQMIADPSPYGASFRTPGGNAPKFYSSQRLHCHRTGFVTSGTKTLGTSHRVKVVKNKVDGIWLPATNEAEYFAGYYDGIQDDISMVHSLVDAKHQSFSHDKGRYKFVFEGESYSFFYKDAAEKLASNPKIRPWLQHLVREQFIMKEFSDGTGEPKEQPAAQDT